MQKHRENYLKITDPNKIKLHNHLENNWNLSNKKALFYNMRAYYKSLNEDAFQYIPRTYHIQNGCED